MRYYRDIEDIRYEPVRHSGPGVASFVIALGVVLIELMVIVVAIAVAATQPEIMGPGSSGEMMTGLGVCFGLVLAIIGVGLGIGGVCQSKRKTVFAVIGLTLNGLILLGGGCLVVIGIATGHH